MAEQSLVLPTFIHLNVQLFYYEFKRQIIKYLHVYSLYNICSDVKGCQKKKTTYKSFMH